MVQMVRNDFQYDAIIAAPNAALDSYYQLDALRVGEVNRARTVMHTAGGKGNNMARALVMLGGRALSIGILGGTSGQFIASELAREGIGAEIVWTTRETRRTTTIPMPALQQSTGVLEAGTAVGEDAMRAFSDAMLAHASDAPFMTLMGSLPPDFPPDYYAQMIPLLRAKGVRVALDTSGAALRGAAKAAPHILKINAEEFNGAFTDSPSSARLDWQQVHAAWNALQARGLEIFVITHGAQGAYVFARGGEPFRVVTPLERWVCPTGSGDSFMAGLLLSLAQGEPLERAACIASAVATANIEHLVSGYIDAAAFEHLLPKTRVEPLTPDYQP